MKKILKIDLMRFVQCGTLPLRKASQDRLSFYKIITARSRHPAELEPTHSNHPVILLSVLRVIKGRK